MNKLLPEPFLQWGSDNGDIDVAVIQLMEISDIDLKLALSIADEIGAVLSKLKKDMK